MAELQAIVEVANAIKGVKTAGNLLEDETAGAGKKSRGKAGKAPPYLTILSEEEEYSDAREEAPKAAVSRKAPACYAAAMSYMRELTAIQAGVDYALRVSGSPALQLLERAKAAAYRATLNGPLSIFNEFLPYPTPPLEELVRKEVQTMASMQKEVAKAVHHSNGIVTGLEAYDAEMMEKFDKAKKRFGTLERERASTERGISELAAVQENTPMDAPAYVSQQVELNNLRRKEKETKNGLEIKGQEIVETYKLSSQVRTKEDVVRAGLHEFRLVNTSVIRFLNFMQKTQAADDLVPQLVQTAAAVGDSYQTLAGIVASGSKATTEAVRQLTEAIGTVDYTLLPNVQREVNRQKGLLEKADKRTTFYEQAVQLLRGAPVTQEGPGRAP